MIPAKLKARIKQISNALDGMVTDGDITTSEKEKLLVVIVAAMLTREAIEE